MTLFQYLNIDEINLLTDSFYAYGDKLAMLKFKPKFMADQVSQKLKSRATSLSEQLQLPITLITTTIPEGHQIPHIIIKNRNGDTIYTEYIVEKPNRHIATPINHIPHIIKVRGLMIRWNFQPHPNNHYNIKPTEHLLIPTQFNTVYPDGSKFDITKYAEIVEILPNTINLSNTIEV
jgi:hypothetical protein